MLYARGVGLTKVVAYSVTPSPLLKQQNHIQEKQGAMNQKPWMKQCWLWGEKKVSLFHTPSPGHDQFPPPFQPNKKNGHVRKKAVIGFAYHTYYLDKWRNINISCYG